MIVKEKTILSDKSPPRPTSDKTNIFIGVKPHGSS